MPGLDCEVSHPAPASLKGQLHQQVTLTCTPRGRLIICKIKNKVFAREYTACFPRKDDQKIAEYKYWEPGKLCAAKNWYGKFQQFITT